MSNPGLLTTLVAFLLLLGPLVFFHEFGHYLAGRWFGVKAETFSIGFGGEIAGWTDKRGTRWKLAWLPLGGYVRFAGDMNPASQPDPAWIALPPAERALTFQSKPLWQRAIIVAAGPLANFLIAVAIFAAMAMAMGVNRTPAVVGTVAAGSAAASAGLKPGDRIVTLGGRDVATYADLQQFIALRPGERTAIAIERDGRPLAIDATIGVVTERDRFGNEYKLGRLGVGASRPVYERLGLFGALGFGVTHTVDTLRAMLDGLGQIITGRRSVDELGGPLRIAKISGEQMSLGWIDFLGLVALVSINLGFINLLPVPMLDGGHLLFYGIEAVRRRPVTARVQEWAFRGGLAALLALMAMTTFHDLGAVGLWQRLAGLIG